MTFFLQKSDVCANGGVVTFELITGYVFTAPSETVTMLPGILHLTECLDWCLTNDTCRSVNFETGLCVLLSSSAIERPEALTPSQFPVFTIYAQKICLRGEYRRNITLLINHFNWKPINLSVNLILCSLFVYSLNAEKQFRPLIDWVINKSFVYYSCIQWIGFYFMTHSMIAWNVVFRERKLRKS